MRLSKNMFALYGTFSQCASINMKKCLVQSKMSVSLMFSMRQQQNKKIYSFSMNWAANLMHPH